MDRFKVFSPLLVYYFSLLHLCVGDWCKHSLFFVSVCVWLDNSFQICFSFVNVWVKFCSIYIETENLFHSVYYNMTNPLMLENILSRLQNAEIIEDEEDFFFLTSEDVAACLE